MHNGVYLVGHRVAPPLAREMAAQLACAPHALISHRSATQFWELVPPPRHPRPVDVTVVGRRPQPGDGIRVHYTASFDRRDAGRKGRLWVTRPARTLLDFAAVATEEELENAVAQARRKKRVNNGELIDQLVRNRGRRGAGRLRALLDLELSPALTRSRRERTLLRLLRASSLPIPEANERACGFEVDLLWRKEKLVVEFDGRGYHSDPLAFERDRLRDATLAGHGYVVIRITDRQLTEDPKGVITRIRQALAHR